MSKGIQLVVHVERYARSAALQRKTTQTCWQRVAELINAVGWQQRKFCNKTLLDVSVYEKAMKNHDSVPTLRTLIAICIAMELSVSATNSLLYSAGHVLNDAIEEHRAFLYILQDLPGVPIGVANDFLIRVGVEPLGSKTFSKTKAV